MFSDGSSVTYFAYLDESGHIGPYVSRQDPRHNDSPVFGLAGIVVSSTQVRGFGTWFFQCKCELLEYEIERSEQHPAQWENQQSSLYTVTNVTRYRELRKFTNRLFNKIAAIDGFISHVGIRKTEPPVSIIRTGFTKRSFARPSNGLTNSAKVTANRLRILSSFSMNMINELT